MIITRTVAKRIDTYSSGFSGSIETSLKLAMICFSASVTTLTQFVSLLESTPLSSVTEAENV